MQSQQAKGFCQSCLYQFHLFFLHSKPSAQGLQGLMSRALTWERGKKHSEKCHYLEGGAGSVLPPNVTMQPFNRANPLKQSKA